MTIFLLSLAVMVLSFVGLSAGILLKRRCLPFSCRKGVGGKELGFQYRDCLACPKGGDLKSQISDLRKAEDLRFQISDLK